MDEQNHQRKDGTQLNFRIRPEMAHAIDKKMEELERATPGLQLNRAETVRILLRKALMLEV